MYNFSISRNLLNVRFSIMPALIPAIAAELANGASDVLEQAGAVVTGNQADYIKNGEPGSIYGKLQQETARQACRRYGDDPGQYSGLPAVLAENACRPYLDDIGYGPGPSIKLPFRGGQCAQGYSVTIRSEVFPFSDCSTFGPGTSTNGFLGPIRGLVTRTVNPSGQLCTPGGNQVSLQHGPPGNESIVAGAGFGATASILNVVPESGGPDICGNPLPEIEPPPPRPVPLPPGPIRFNPGPDIDIDIDVTINPDLSFDVDFGTGPINIDPFGGGDGGGGEPGGDGGDPGDPTDPGSPGAGGSTGAGGAADGEAPEGEELVGLLVTVTEAPGDANRFDNNSAQPFRGIGYVRMGYPGRLGLDISGGTVISPQFFHAQQRGLTNWAVAANIGFNLTIVPYYRSIES